MVLYSRDELSGEDGYFYVIGGVESEKNRRSETRKGPSAAISQS